MRERRGRKGGLEGERAGRRERGLEGEGAGGRGAGRREGRGKAS